LLLKRLGVLRLAATELNSLRRTSIERHAGCEAIDPGRQALPEAAFDYVIDGVGSKVTRQQAFAAIKPGGVIMHVGLQDWASEIDMRKLTLGEITLLGTYTYTTADLRATVDALDRGMFGDLAWVEQRPLADGAAAFADLNAGRSAAAKIVLVP
jgi:alcohol dehydrogenase